MNNKRHFFTLILMLLFLFSLAFQVQASSKNLKALKVRVTRSRDGKDLKALPQLNLTCLLQGLYKASDPEDSIPANGDYAGHIELRNTPGGTHSNYRYYYVPLDKYGNTGDIDLGNITDGDYYIAIRQRNHLVVRTVDPFNFSADNTTIIDISDPESPYYAQTYGFEPLWPEPDGKFSLRAGDANGDGVVNASGDFVRWRNANGSTPDSPNWDIGADFNADEVINASGDFVLWRNNNGRSANTSIDPLDIEITSPQDGSYSNQTSITVSGTINDNNATVEVNGIAATISDGTFTAENVPLETEGDNLITATAQDGQTNEASHSITVTRDTETPQIEITTPEDGSIVVGYPES